MMNAVPSAAVDPQDANSRASWSSWPRPAGKPMSEQVAVPALV
jgi:hypothetical protein